MKKNFLAGLFKFHRNHYEINRVRAILSMTRALLGEVSPNLRKATIKWDNKKIHLYFYYDGEISEDDNESAEFVLTEVIADFPKYEFGIDILRCDYPQKPPEDEGEIIYFRRESRPNMEI